VTAAKGAAKSAAEVDRLRKLAAEELWERLGKDLFSVQTTIIEIIESRAWEPLGYATFAEAWRDRMSDLTIAPEIRPHVVYQMFAEGAGADTVADAVKGIGPEAAKELKRQRDIGVPASEATHVVREHRRRAPARHFVTFELSGDDAAAWQAKARRAGKSVNSIAAEATAAAFRALP
jgi:hypothetical protein